METLHQALEDVRRRYATANPRSMAADKEADRYLPGGNTRNVLHYEPFPLTMVVGEGAELVDLDGHRYVDFVGEFSAGLFGHSDEIVKVAVHKALDIGVVMGAPIPLERELAGILCRRFPSLEQIRFCNSGTEATIMALTTARIVTGRNKVLVFNGAYHGGVIKFPTGLSVFNVPFDYLLAEFNDTEGTAEIIRQSGNELAAVIVEPILGAGGSIPGTKEFLEMLRQTTREVGALLIFDEVKTARLGPTGVQGMLGIEPDLTTLGKIIGGGLPTGAFGGPAELMAHYNPKREGTWKHAGTFNNNVCSMGASEAFRNSLNRMFAEKAVPMFCNGLGSMFTIHFTCESLHRMAVRSATSQTLSALLHMELLLDGVLVCSRGDMFLSLPMTEQHLSKARTALEGFVDRYKTLMADVS